MWVGRDGKACGGGKVGQRRGVGAGCRQGGWQAAGAAQCVVWVRRCAAGSAVGRGKGKGGVVWAASVAAAEKGGWRCVRGKCVREVREGAVRDMYVVWRKECASRVLNAAVVRIGREARVQGVCA